MEVLSVQSLSDAMCRCAQYDNYRVIVALNSMRQTREFMESTLREVDMDLYGVHTVAKLAYNSVIMTFCNGSYIKTIVANEHSRGHKCNELIYDEGISQDVVQCILAPMLCTYKVKEICNDNECKLVDGSEIDDFLNEFKIYGS